MRRGPVMKGIMIAPPPPPRTPLRNPPEAPATLETRALRGGVEALRRLLRGMTLSLIVFVGFFLVVGLTMPRIGLAQSFVLASALALASQAIALVVMRGFARI